MLKFSVLLKVNVYIIFLTFSSVVIFMLHVTGKSEFKCFDWLMQNMHFTHIVCVVCDYLLHHQQDLRRKDLVFHTLFRSSNVAKWIFASKKSFRRESTVVSPFSFLRFIEERHWIACLTFPPTTIYKASWSLWFYLVLIIWSITTRSIEGEEIMKDLSAYDVQFLQACPLKQHWDLPPLNVLSLCLLMQQVCIILDCSQ